MAEVLLSEGERTFILHGIQDGFRCDGRTCTDYRNIEVETDVVSNASGSSRVRLANTDVLVGVKAEIGPPASSRPNEGRLEFFLDCSANAAPEFEGRGGEELATDICGTLARAYSSSQAFDLKSLCIIPDEQCWVLYVDVLLLECGGNLYDTVSLAVKSALFNARIPNLLISTDDNGKHDVAISDDPYDCTRLKAESSPLLVTLNKVGKCHVVDASMEEEACCLCFLVVGVTPAGTITTVKKGGSGSLTPDSVADMTETGRMVGCTLNNALLQRLREEDSMTNRKRMGFLH